MKPQKQPYHVEEEPEMAALHGLIDVSVWEDNVRRLSSELHRNPLQIGPGSRLADNLANLPTRGICIETIIVKISRLQAACFC